MTQRSGRGAHPQAVLDRIATALRPDGVYLCVGIAAQTEVADNLDHPLGPFFYGVSTMHCMTVSLSAGGDGLGTMWGEQKASEMFVQLVSPALRAED